MVDPHPYTFVPAHGMHKTKVTPDVNCGLWVMMCQYRFIGYNTCTTLMGDVDNGEGYAPVGEGVSGNSLYIPLNFCCASKTPLLKKIY